MTTKIAKDREVDKRKQTIVRRVSDLFKADEKKKFGPPSLFRQNSMQALRHCCQNLNLFPYLLYTFARNTTEQPMTMLKFNKNFALLFSRIAERIFRVYANIPQTLIFRWQSTTTANDKISTIEKIPKTSSIAKNPEKINDGAIEVSPKFEKFERQRPKANSWFLRIAVYFAPLILALQIVGVISLIGFGKYSPGFVFLVAALFFLGYISMKVLNHDNETVQIYKREKRKSE